jgi:BirA family biotin operon repressor/biotin-[acetyl-CoA-carboxylase] ligase
MAATIGGAGYDEERIRSLLGTGRFGRELRFFKTVDSTQRVALDLAEKGLPEGTLVVADEQTAGMGRRGRGWHSARGLGVWMSLLLRPAISPSEGGLLSAWAGLAVLQALAPGGWGSARAGLKWPNDVLVDGRKLCGILVDARSVGERLTFAVVGVGLNVNHDAADFPSDVAATAASLKMVKGEASDRAAILGEVVRAMERTYDAVLGPDGRRSLAAGAQGASVLIGSGVSVKGPRRTLSGIAVRIEDDGGLVVDTGGGREEKILAGDVEMVRFREEET